MIIIVVRAFRVGGPACDDAQGIFVELRNMMRYQLDLPVTFRWRDHLGHVRWGAGFTNDVSAVGMFLFSHDIPAENVLLQCEVKLPRLRDVGCIPVTVCGRVVRVQESTDWRKNGFAVVGEMLELCNEASAEESKVEPFTRTLIPSKRTN